MYLIRTIKIIDTLIRILTKLFTDIAAQSFLNIVLVLLVTKQITQQSFLQ